MGSPAAHGDFGIDPRVDDEILAGHFAHGLDDLAEVGVLVVGGDGRTVLLARLQAAGNPGNKSTMASASTAARWPLGCG
jgi:hypothetical protein